MPKKLLSCVKKVKLAGGPNAKYAYPICIKSTGLHPHKKKDKLMNWEKKWNKSNPYNAKVIVKGGNK